MYKLQLYLRAPHRRKVCIDRIGLKTLPTEEVFNITLFFKSVYHIFLNAKNEMKTNDMVKKYVKIMKEEKEN